MRLVELRANKESFKTVHFNRSGLSIIVANKRTNDDKNTYNSVGKSLCIGIVHFCLASNSNKAFADKLQGWEFELEFEVDGVIYTSKRSTNEQKHIILNGIQISIDEFKDKFGAEVFGLAPETKYLSFRSLISRFVRPSRASYKVHSDYIDDEPSFNRLINNCYLLGLDTELVIRKYDLKKSLDESKYKKKAFDNDSSLKEYFSDINPKNIDIEIFTLEKELEQLSKGIADFKVADNYTKIQDQANNLSRNLRDKRNEIVILKNSLIAIQRSTESHVDISAKKLQKLFGEAAVYFKEILVGQLDDLETFHKNLIEDRAKFLAEERRKFEAKILVAEKELGILSIEQNESLSFLHSHGALDDYAKLTEKQSSLQIKLQKLKQFNDILKHNRLRVEEIKQAFSSENLKADIYLNSIDDIKKKNVLLFNYFATSFYENKSSGITIENNSGENMNRFKIEAKIQDDKGDAVSEVKIFCFDWTILEAKHSHSVDFLFHDSRILDGVDTRQVAKMIRLAHDECNKYGFQYILSANHNNLESLKSEMTEDEFDEIISSNQILELNDLSNEGKLLGIQVDLDY